MHTFDVEIVDEGKTYTATASISQRILTVNSPMLGSKSAQVYSEYQFLAKQLLRELVQANQRQQGGTMNTEEEKTRLVQRIEEMERGLHSARCESKAWNAGKYKNGHIAEVSKILVNSYEKELKELKERLAALG